jgi:hypothetical protein
VVGGCVISVGGGVVCDICRWVGVV